MAIEAHTFIVTQQPTDPLKWVIPEKFQGRFCTPSTMKGMGSILGEGGGGNKKKRSRSPATSGHRMKGPNRSNNPLITCDLFNKAGCNWAFCERTHKCKECGSKNHGMAECTSKGRKKS